MLVRDYERAKSLASSASDEALSAKIRRLDRLGLYLALAGLASFAAMFGADAVRGLAPGFFREHEGAHRVLTILLPALGLAAFLIGGDVVRRKRGVIELARRLKAEMRGEEARSCSRG